MDSTHGGVSRSGRVRKKPAKLMEMELSTDDRSLSMSSSDRPAMTASNYVASKTAALSSALMGCSPVLHSGPTSPVNMPSSGQTQQVRKQAVRSTTLPIVQRVQPPPPASVASAADDREAQNPRVIAIKAMDTSPSFDNLSGSTYLIGDDVHFITGEPVDSESEQVEDNDDDHGHQQRGYRLSPLKLDIGGHVIDETAAAAVRSSVVNQDDGGGDGLRMKFILSPKNSSSSSFDKVKGNQSKSKKSKKSSRSHSKKSSSSGGGGSKSKKKKKSKQSAADDQEHQSPPNLYPSDSFRGMPVLEVLAAGGGGGLLPRTFHGSDSDSDNVDDESNLIIAEPPVLQPMVPIGKSKSNWSAKTTTPSSKPRKKGGGSSSKNVQKQQMSYDGEENFDNVPMAAEVLGQQHSVYLKEKNASKKKSGKKATKAKDKGGNFKARPQSAYMLWCREYRSHIVQENPGIDFATISKRLGEVWQSLSEFDKMNWRRKAKVSSCKPAATGTSTLINTCKKRNDSASSNKPAGGGGGGAGNINSGKVSYKGAQTGAAAASAAAAQRASDEAAAAGQLAITRPVGTTPLDVAAHLKLLGESLSIIGQRLTEHEGQIAVSGSLSVLLDSTLCALGPLVCLSSEVDQLNGCAKSIQERILDNIAYIMPGL